MQKAVALTSFAGIALAGAVSPTYSATDPLLWDNYTSGYSEYGISSQLDTSYPFDSQAADDFVFTDDASITGVTWAGWYGNFEGTQGDFDYDAVGFRILFYADNGGIPTGGPTDPTGTALAVFDIAAGDITRTPPAIGSVFTFSADLGGSLNVIAGTNYWIAIQAIVDYPPQWYWSPSLDQTGASAVAGFPLVGENYWGFGVTDPLNGDGPADMAFKLHGSSVPAPGALALLGCAGLAHRRRRRR